MCVPLVLRIYIYSHTNPLCCSACALNRDLSSNPSLYCEGVYSSLLTTLWKVDGTNCMCVNSSVREGDANCRATSNSALSEDQFQAITDLADMSPSWSYDGSDPCQWSKSRSIISCGGSGLPKCYITGVYVSPSCICCPPPWFWGLGVRPRE